MRRPFEFFYYLYLMSFFFWCDTLKNSLGFDHSQPDEFVVDQNSSLVFPKTILCVLPHSTQNISSLDDDSTQKAQGFLGVKPCSLKTSSSTKTHHSLIGEFRNQRNDNLHIRKIVDQEAKKDHVDSNIVTEKSSEIVPKSTDFRIRIPCFCNLQIDRVRMKLTSLFIKQYI